MWWAIVRTPDGVSLWPVGEQVPDLRLVTAARVLTYYPAGDLWVGAGEYDLSLSLGEPHPKLIEKAKRIGTVEELRKVDTSDLDIHEADMLAAGRAQREAYAKVALAALDADARARVVAAVAVEEVPDAPADLTR